MESRTKPDAGTDRVGQQINRGYEYAAIRPGIRRAMIYGCPNPS